MKIFVGYGYNDRDRWVEQFVFPIIEAFGSEVVAACIRALSDDSRSVRSRAARALGRLASPRAALPLVGALGDGYWSVRRDAENSIMNLGPRAVPPLIDVSSIRVITPSLAASPL